MNTIAYKLSDDVGGRYDCGDRQGAVNEVMCGRIYIVGDKGNDCWRCREAFVVIKFVGAEFRNANEYFIVSGTLGEGHILCKDDAGGLVLGL